jgi:hypothetical protein
VPSSVHAGWSCFAGSFLQIGENRENSVKPELESLVAITSADPCAENGENRSQNAVYVHAIAREPQKFRYRRATAYDQTMLASLLIIALVAGLFLYLYPFTNAKVVRIGEMLLFSSILALLIATAPATVKLLAS